MADDAQFKMAAFQGTPTPTLSRLEGCEGPGGEVQGRVTSVLQQQLLLRAEANHRRVRGWVIGFSRAHPTSQLVPHCAAHRLALGNAPAFIL